MTPYTYFCQTSEKKSIYLKRKEDNNYYFSIALLLMPTVTRTNMKINKNQGTVLPSLCTHYTK